MHTILSYGSREWNGTECGRGRRGGRGNIKIFSSNLHDLQKSSCRPQGGGHVRKDPKAENEYSLDT